jgi:hypothetical protein
MAWPGRVIFASMVLRQMAASEPSRDVLARYSPIALGCNMEVESIDIIE